MKRKIFFSILITCIAALLVCTLLVSAFLWRYYSDRQQASMETQLVYLSHMAEEHNIEHFDSLDSEQQITILGENGQIILNNNKIDLSEEALTEIYNEASGGGTGYYMTRLSISEKLLLLSTRLENGNVLCIGSIQHTYISLIMDLLGYVAIILIAAAVTSLCLARFLSRRILRPVYEMDLTTPDKKGVYPELLPFVDKINEQNEEINKRLLDIESHHEAQDKMRREFTANVSHELKTPLTSISGYAELIRDGLARPEDIPGFAGKIHDESKRMINLVGDIIKLSQLDEKDISVTIERIDLYNCCQAVIRSLEPLAEKHNITFELEGDHCEINGGEIIIEEIVHNICDNAVKYNKEGGSVKVSIRQCIDGVELAVTDTGIGIAKEDLNHVFERFYRADKSHSKEIGGTGLGLSIVKHGAMFHNACVSIDSTPGVGTTVRILF